MMMHRTVLPLLIVLSLLPACAESEDAARRADEGPPIPAVEVVQAELGSLPLEERLSGRVRAENQVIIYPEIAAPVVRVTAEDGDYVRQGAPLVYLRDTQYQEQLRQAEANLKISQAAAARAEGQLEELESRLVRTEELAARQFLSTQELETQRAQVAAARATHEQALAQIALAQANIEEQQEALRRAVVRAPINGYVGGRNVEVGMRVEPGTQLFIIGNLDVVRVEVAIPDKLIGQIQEGQTALISSGTLGGRTLRAEVSRISPFLESGSYSAEAQIDVPNSDGLLQPGMFVAVDVQYGESRQATLVPLSALYENPTTGVIGVYVAASLGAEIPVHVPDTYDAQSPPPLLEPTPMTFRRVTVLARGRETVGLEGVQPGAWVVTVGQNLLDGTSDERPQARVRAIPWDRVAALQRLQDKDLLRNFMEKQQRLANRQESEAASETEAAAPPSRAATAP